MWNSWWHSDFPHCECLGLLSVMADTSTLHSRNQEYVNLSKNHEKVLQKNK